VKLRRKGKNNVMKENGKELMKKERNENGAKMCEKN
jgi:hypothetical protein